MDDKVTHQQMSGLSLPELRNLLNKQIGLKQRMADKNAETRAALGTFTTNIHNIRARIKSLSPADEPTEITDHAILRYLERVRGVNMDEIRAELDTPVLREAIKRNPTGRITINGVVFAIENKVLVTVIYPDGDKTP